MFVFNSQKLHCGIAGPPKAMPVDNGSLRTVLKPTVWKIASGAEVHLQSTETFFCESNFSPVKNLDSPNFLDDCCCTWMNENFSSAHSRKQHLIMEQVHFHSQIVLN